MRPALTVDEVLALPAAVDLPTAGKAFGPDVLKALGIISETPDRTTHG